MSVPTLYVRIIYYISPFAARVLIRLVMPGSCQLLLSVPLDPALLVLVFGDNVLEELVDGPADGG